MDISVQPDFTAPKALHYLYPGVVFFCFLSLAISSACKLQSAKPDKRPTSPLACRRAAVAALGVFWLTYMAQLITLAAYSVATHSWPPEECIVVGALSCLLVFGLQLAWLCDPATSFWYPYQYTWVVALFFEAWFAAVAILCSMHAPAPFKLAGAVFATSRCLALLLLITMTYTRCDDLAANNTAVEDQEPLLFKTNTAVRNNGYGSTSSTETGNSDDENSTENNWERRQREAQESMENRLQEGGSWFVYAKEYMVSIATSCVASLLWTTRDKKKLQFHNGY